MALDRGWTLDTLLCYVYCMANIGEGSIDAEVARWETQLRKGSLGLAVLATLAESELYGLEILQRLEEAAGFSVPEGTIYPLLQRLKDSGFVEARWVDAQRGHPRKYYRLTGGGRRFLQRIADRWSEFAQGMDCLLGQLKKVKHVARQAG
jgi:PadR family transcriptional regulator, regulatory protein PadR